VESAISSVLKTVGRIDAVHNNAGIATPSKPLHETDEEEWDKLQRINLKSVYWTSLWSGISDFRFGSGFGVTLQSLQVSPNFGGMLITEGAIFLQGLADNLFQLRRKGRDLSTLPEWVFRRGWL